MISINDRERKRLEEVKQRGKKDAEFQENGEKSRNNLEVTFKPQLKKK